MPKAPNSSKEWSFSCWLSDFCILQLEVLSETHLTCVAFIARHSIMLLGYYNDHSKVITLLLLPQFHFWNSSSNYTIQSSNMNILCVGMYFT